MLLTLRTCRGHWHSLTSVRLLVISHSEYPILLQLQIARWHILIGALAICRDEQGRILQDADKPEQSFIGEAQCGLCTSQVVFVHGRNHEEHAAPRGSAFDWPWRT